jgi:RNA polymerase sigma-54 factor
MRQRIELLAMTKLELSDMVITEMVANPMLEEVAPGETPDGQSSTLDDIATIDATTADYTERETKQPAAEPSIDGSASSEGGEASIEAASFEGDVEPERERDSFQEIDFGTTFEEYLDPGYKTQEYEARDEVSFESLLTRQQSLSEQLLWQLHLCGVPADVIAAGEAIIGTLQPRRKHRISGRHD